MNTETRATLIENIVKEARYLRSKGIFPDSEKELIKAFKRRMNLNAIMLCLQRMKQYFERHNVPPDKPASYFWGILWKESGNYHANEHARESKSRECTPEQAGAILKRIQQCPEK